MRIETSRAIRSPAALQRGAVLVVGLIMLVMITLITISGMQATTLEERMAGNLADRNRAFQSAEIALRTGEELVEPGKPFVPGVGMYEFEGTQAPIDIYLESNWTGKSLAFGEKVKGSAAAPRYMVEMQPKLNANAPLEAGVERTTEVFRVNSIGWGAGLETVVVLQSIFNR